MKIKTIKCKECNIPIDGWRYHLIVKPICKITSHKCKTLCCKCAKDKNKK